MPTQADANRIQKLRAIRAMATNEGWSSERLDEVLAPLYQRRRAPAKSKQAKA